MDEDTYTSRVAAELRVDLARSGKRQAAVAALLDVTGDWLSRRLRGQIAMTLDDLERVCTAIGERPMAQVLVAVGATTDDQAVQS